MKSPSANSDLAEEQIAHEVPDRSGKTRSATPSTDCERPLTRQNDGSGVQHVPHKPDEMKAPTVRERRLCHRTALRRLLALQRSEIVEQRCKAVKQSGDKM